MNSEYIEFVFQNKLFNTIKQQQNNISLIIKRKLRIEPMVDMKQPTPIGGMMGYEAILKLMLDNLPYICKWELYKNDKIIQTGQTDIKGYSYNLNLDISSSNYKLRIII